MLANMPPPCFAAAKAAESRVFHVKRSGAKMSVDRGWYGNMQTGEKKSALQFMALRQPPPPACNPVGLMVNFSVNDVEAGLTRLAVAGLSPRMPRKDHPWGNRGFAVLDPNGNMLYIYSPREPADGFKQASWIEEPNNGVHGDLASSPPWRRTSGFLQSINAPLPSGFHKQQGLRL